MLNAAGALVAASGAVILLLGSLHLLYTFRGPKLHPRDAALVVAMQDTALVITRQTTVWRAWVGFNASHSFGAMLFGLVYGYLALAAPALLFGSLFLRVVGLVLLLGYVALARRYWFSIPFRGIVLATLLYAAGCIVAAM